MTVVNKFEFLKDGKFTVIEQPIEKTDRPKFDGEFIRSWTGETGKHSIKRPPEVKSGYLNALLQKNGYKKARDVSKDTGTQN